MSEQNAIQAAAEALNILIEADLDVPSKQDSAHNRVRRAIGLLKGAAEMDKLSANSSPRKFDPAPERPDENPVCPVDDSGDKDLLVVFVDETPSLPISAVRVESTPDWVHFLRRNGAMDATVASRSIRAIVRSSGISS